MTKKVVRNFRDELILRNGFLVGVEAIMRQVYLTWDHDRFIIVQFLDWVVLKIIIVVLVIVTTAEALRM